jgi:hypothetical protein
VPIPTSYYVWYRLAGDAADAHKAIAAMLKDVFVSTGILGRLLVRRDDPRTWMEAYENVADGKLFEEKLDAAELRYEVARFAADGRHREPFVSPL